MTLHILDHVFFILIAAAMPIHGYFWLRKRAALINQGRTELRLALYRTTIKEEWAVTIALVGLWFALGRSGSELGFGLPGGLLVWGGYALTALIGSLLVVQMKTMMATPENRTFFRKQIGKLSFLVPHTVAERSAFSRVSVTAGICEEILYRGFAIAYLMTLLGVPFWAAALISSVIFGLAHSYQGPTGFLRTGAVGLALATVYGLTGALWAPILLHALLDLTMGWISYNAFSDACPENTSPTLAV